MTSKTVKEPRGTTELGLRRIFAKRGQFAVLITLALSSLLGLVPILWSLSVSFMGKKDLYAETPVFLPTRLVIDNYQWVLKVAGIGGASHYGIWFRNSVIVSGIAVLITVIVATMAGYAFARLRFPGRNLIFYTVMLLVFIPKSGGLMALFEEMHFLGLRNNLVGLGLLLAGGGGFMGSGMPISIFIMRQFFLQVPREYEDAALIDGASRLQLFLRIMLPMAASAIIVIMIVTLIDAWGEYLVSITMVDDPRLWTLGVGVAGIFMGGTVAMAQVTGYGSQAAAYNMFTVPVVIVFILTQKWFIKGLTGGLKM